MMKNQDPIDPPYLPYQESVSSQKSQRSQTMHAILKQYIDDSTIHGLKDVYKHWSDWPLRFLCALFQLACIVAMLWHMILVVEGYVDQPTIVQTTTVHEPRYAYPAVTFCPRDWLNVSKYQELGIPKSSFLYAVSLLKRVDVNETVNSTEAKLELDRFMMEKNISSYFEFYILLANDYENRSLYCERCSTWPPKKVVTEEGVCYYMQFEDFVSSIIDERDPRITYNPLYPPDQHEPGSILESFYTIDFSENMYLGAHEKDFFDVEPVFMLLNTTYVMRVTPKKHKYISGIGIPCVTERKSESMLMCQAYCQQRTMTSLCGMPYMLGFFNGSSSIGPATDNATAYPLWSSLIDDSDLYDRSIEDCDRRFDDAFKQCIDACPAVCEKMSYTTAVTSIRTRRLLQNLNESSLSLLIQLQVRSGMLVTEETMSYTWFSFLSNVGGVLGLWCGCSLLSLCQLLVMINQQITYVVCGRVPKIIREDEPSVPDVPATEKISVVSNVDHTRRSMFSQGAVSAGILMNSYVRQWQAVQEEI